MNENEEKIEKPGKSMEYIQAFYREYQAGERTLDEWVLLIFEDVKFYIRKKIRENKRDYAAKKDKAVELEDIEMSAFLGIMENIHKYDPFLQMPVVYFSGVIQEYTKLNIDPEVSKHYADSFQKMQKILKASGFSGVDDERLTYDKIAVICDMSLKTVISAVKHRSIQKVSYDTVDVYMEAPYDTPEEALLRRETSEEIQRVVEKFNPFEKWLLDIMIMNPRDPLTDYPELRAEEERQSIDLKSKYRYTDYDKKPSFRRIVIVLNRYDEFKNVFAKYLPKKKALTAHFLEETMHSVMRRIKADTTIRKIVPKKYDVFIYEQSDDNDIMNALCDNVI